MLTFSMFSLLLPVLMYPKLHFWMNQDAYRNRSWHVFVIKNIYSQRRWWWWWWCWARKFVEFESRELSGVEGHGVDDWWLVSRVANGELAITFFDFVIEKKTNPLAIIRFSQKHFWKISCSRSNNNSLPRLYFLDKQHLFNGNYHWSILTGITFYFTRVISNS